MTTSAMRQCFLIPAPTLTEKNLPDQTGRVHIVTGGYAGCGEELSKLLYGQNATVYIAGRSKEKADKAMERIQASSPASKGKVVFLHLDLADLTTIKPAAQEFMSKETRLDTLTNNAGVMAPPNGSKTAQGYELQIGTNCLGPWLFSEQLLPILKKTAATAPKNGVRVTWAASLAIQFSPKGGVPFDAKTNAPQTLSQFMNYSASKAGNVLLASEFARRYGNDGIISVAWNPGNLRSELSRHMSSFQSLIMDKTMLYDTIYGGYTELWAACSEEITEKENGAFIAPWGRIFDTTKDLQSAVKSEEEGGSGSAKRFWEWCEMESRKHS